MTIRFYEIALLESIKHCQTCAFCTYQFLEGGDEITGDTLRFKCYLDNKVHTLAETYNKCDLWKPFKEQEEARRGMDEINKSW